MLPECIQKKIVKNFTLKFQSDIHFISFQNVGGGDINYAGKFKTSNGNYFIKWNHADLYPEMFEKEANGLNLLSSTKQIIIPEVLFYDSAENYNFLVLELIEKYTQEKNFWKNFGLSLARLHRNTSDYFGLEYDNYIGYLIQSNKRNKNWVDFFVEERINFQLKKALDSQLFDKSILKVFERLFYRLDNWIPNEQPALLHGDLWSGNFMIGKSGKACLIDPAVYYGHREMDIAMTKLFGEFNENFYKAYHEEWPMENQWEQRMDIYNLYPLLVHVNLFGGGYISKVESVLKKF